MAGENWGAGWKALVDAIVDEWHLESGGMFSSGFVDAVIGTVLELYHDDVDGWDEFDVVTGDDGGGETAECALTADQWLVVRIRWLGLHFFVEAFGPFAWSVSGVDAESIRMLVRPSLLPQPTASLDSVADGVFAQLVDEAFPGWGPLSWDQKVAGLLGLRAFHHTSVFPAIVTRDPEASPPHGRYRLSRAQRNPAAAYKFVSTDLPSVLGSNEWMAGSLGTSWAGVDALTQWVHGPLNRYGVCHPLDCAEGSLDAEKLAALGYVGASEDWADVANFVWGNVLALEHAPFTVMNCVLDGSQAWTHTAKPYILDNWWQKRLAIEMFGGTEEQHVSVRSFGFLSRVKVGGCQELSEFFTTALAAMNIPAIRGMAPLDQVEQGNPILGRHSSVWLPQWDLAVRHGDDLWGPGASLFPSDRLWADAAAALSSSRAWLGFVLEHGVYFRPGVGWAYLAEKYPDSAWLTPRKAFVATYMASTHAKYWLGRRYFAAMLDSATETDYAQCVLDACTFGVGEESTCTGACGKVQFLEALKYWMQNVGNPLVKTFPWDFWDTYMLEVLPHLPLGDWTESVPPGSVWDEPSIGALVCAVVDHFGLGELDGIVNYGLALPEGGSCNPL